MPEPTPRLITLRCSEEFYATATTEKGVRAGKLSIQLMEIDDEGATHEMVFTVLP